MAKETQANLGFEKQLWDAACVLWGSIPAAEYRQIIVGLIFLRYISAAFEKRHAELVPDKDTAHDFNEIVLPMIRVIQSSYEENKHLRDLRDNLLPRLMSGELDVSDVDF